MQITVGRHRKVDTFGFALWTGTEQQVSGPSAWSYGPIRRARDEERPELTREFLAMASTEARSQRPG